MIGRTVWLSVLFALILVIACSSSGEADPAQQVAGEFRLTNSALVQSAVSHEISPTFPVPGRTGVSASEARSLAEQSLRSGVFPQIVGGVMPREIHFATRDEMTVLSRAGALGFGINSLPPRSDLFWIVNFLDFRGDNEATGYMVRAPSDRRGRG